jgi:hypothetical protein
MQPSVSITSGDRRVTVELGLDDDAMIASLPPDFRRELDSIAERALVERSLGIRDADVMDRFAHDLAVDPDAFEQGKAWATLVAAWARLRAEVLRAGQRPTLYVHAEG